MTDPTFSICIPNYNYGRFIGDTIRSVLDQSYPHFEIIVVDNASTDDSIDVVRSFDDPRIRLFQNRANVGFAPNLQRATMLARNDFVNLLSSDDQMKPGALETYARAIRGHSADAARLVLLSNAEGFDNDDRVTRYMEKAPATFARLTSAAPTELSDGRVETFRGLDVLRDCLLRLDTPGVFCATVYSRALWEAIEGYTGQRTIGPDKHFAYRLLLQDPLVVYVRAPLFRYRDYVSDNRAATAVTMRQPVDDYLNVLEFGSDEVRSRTGVARADLERAYLDRVLRDAWVRAGAGDAGAALRFLGFALGTFPGRALRRREFWGLLPLLCLGPLLRVVGPALRRTYIGRRDSDR